MEILGLIPARGGSKSIHGKNIINLAGRPLLDYTIRAAKKSGILGRIVVTTDCEKIAHVSSELGAEVPFLRPGELAQDDTPSMDAVVHAIEWLADNDDYLPDFVMLLQPTSPLRTAADIISAVEIAKEKSADSVVSVCKMEPSPYLARTINSDGKLAKLFDTDSQYTRRQDMPPAYVLNGAIYLTKRESILKDKTFFPPKTYPIIMPAERSVDIDDPLDLELAEAILHRRNSSQQN